MRVLAGVTLTGALLLSAACARDAEPPGDAHVEATPPVSSATSRGAVEPWLGAPWSLQSSRGLSWSPGMAVPYDFCGASYVTTGSGDVGEQTFTDPSGRTARLLELSPEPDEVMQLFKFSYAGCLVPGRAEGVGGPRNLWSVGAVEAASEPVGTTLRILELRGKSVERSDAAALMDGWRRWRP